MFWSLSLNFQLSWNINPEIRKLHLILRTWSKFQANPWPFQAEATKLHQILWAWSNFHSKPREFQAEATKLQHILLARSKFQSSPCPVWFSVRIAYFNTVWSNLYRVFYEFSKQIQNLWICLKLNPNFWIMPWFI